MAVWLLNEYGWNKTRNFFFSFSFHHRSTCRVVFTVSPSYSSQAILSAVLSSPNNNGFSTSSIIVRSASQPASASEWQMGKKLFSHWKTNRFVCWLCRAELSNEREIFFLRIYLSHLINYLIWILIDFCHSNCCANNAESDRLKVVLISQFSFNQHYRSWLEEIVDRRHRIKLQIGNE